MNWYVEVLKKYAVFSGRARRKEYWMFFLFNIIIAFVLGFIEGLAGSSGLIGIFYSLAVLIPGIAVSVRRLHDTDRSGWWLLIGLVPIVGAIVLLVFMVFDSQSGQNQYGEYPKESIALTKNIHSETAKIACHFAVAKATANFAVPVILIVRFTKEGYAVHSISYGFWDPN